MRALSVLGLVCSLFIYSQANTCPRLRTRMNWGADAPTSSTKLDPQPSLVLVKEAGKKCTNRGLCSTEVKRVQVNDMETFGFSDVDCNFLIGSDGQVYEGRGWTMGSLVPSGISICMLGKFDKKGPDSIQAETLKKFIQCSYNIDKLDSSYKVQAWSDVFSAFKGKNPGKFLYQTIQELPQYSAPAKTE